MLIGALTTMISSTGCWTTEPTLPTRTETTSLNGWGSRGAPASPELPSRQSSTGSKPPSTAAPTVEEKAGRLEGAQSPILGIELPGGSKGTWNVNDFNDDGKPNRFENWNVPLSYHATIDYLSEQLNPHYTRPDDMPWLDEIPTEGELGERYTDWWWGVGKPELLVRIQEFGEVNETTVMVGSRLK